MSKDNRGILIVTFNRNCNIGGALQEFALYAYIKKIIPKGNPLKEEIIYDRVKNLDYTAEMYDTLSRPIRGGVFKKIFLICFSAIGAVFKKNKKCDVANNQQHYSVVLISPRVQFMQLIDRLYLTFSDILHYKERKKCIENYHKFHADYIEYTDNYTIEQLADEKLMSNLFKDYSTCIVGSDQVWNASWIGASPVYFLGFVPKGIRKASYASSLGNYKFDNEKINNRIASYISDFAGVGVRENHSVADLKKNCNIEAKNVLDPTLLLTKEMWCSLLGIKQIKEEPYLLVYVLGDRKNLISFAKRVAEKLKLKVKIIDTKFLFSKNDKNVEYLPSTGPREFVELYSRASFVITNSFHGTAFSINFNVPFFTVASIVNERARSILEIAGLTERIVTDCENFDLSNTELDFTEVNKRIDEERQKSVEYLQEVLDCKNTKGNL